LFKKILKKVLLGLVLILIAGFLSYFLITPPPAKKIVWGLNFSQKQAQNLGLNWKETYLSILDDLKVKDLKIATYWDLIEPKEGEFNFEDLDFQIIEAQKRKVKILLVIGIKTPRWPECHLPHWLKEKKLEERNQKLLEYLKKVINRYQPSPSIFAWQIENEPFFPFGECPQIKKDFLKKEITLIKSLDPKRPILISDSGEFSLWITAARLGDLVGTTLHRRVWVEKLKIYLTHQWFSPTYYWLKSKLIKKIFKKEVICVELQAEPWGPKSLPQISLKEQQKTMNLEIFKENIDFAKKTGIRKFYLWGGEWWFWLKQKHQDSQIWEEAKKLFK